jgi:hypothetical protein
MDMKPSFEDERRRQLDALEKLDKRIAAGRKAS